MQGVTRGTAYGYSLYELEVYGPAATATNPTGGVSITTAPANQSATIGGTATFTVVAGGTGPFTYQWLKAGAVISGATAATYTTPTLTAADNNTSYSVTVGTTAGTTTVTSTAATLTVGTYTVYPGFLGVDLVNNTGGAWTNAQVYVTVIGIDPATNNYAYVTPSGTIVDFTSADSTASNHVTAPNGQAYGNYSFTLAQSTLLKLPIITSARAYISLGAPLYVPVYANSAGKITGYAGPNPQNGTDPNINTHFDWYELNYGTNGTVNTVYVNTTQVDEFGLPLVLDVWASSGAFHKQVGITESITQIDKEFAATVPSQFQPTTMSNLRILSPAKLSLAAGATNGNYFDSTIATAWANFAKTPITITLSGRQFTGSASGTTLTFTEVNPTNAYAGRTTETFVIHQPSTQDVLVCGGTMASGVSYVDPNSDPVHYDENNVQLQLQNQICSATNRGILLTPTSNWTNVSAYYGTSPGKLLLRLLAQPLHRRPCLRLCLRRQQQPEHHHHHPTAGTHDLHHRLVASRRTKRMATAIKRWPFFVPGKVQALELQTQRQLPRPVPPKIRPTRLRNLPKVRLRHIQLRIGQIRMVQHIGKRPLGP